MKLSELVSLCGMFIIGYLLGCFARKEVENKSFHVEENIKVDSLIKKNDSIKLKVERLDSIKNAKVIEVTTLDNDSTLKLFYELVKE